MHPILKKGNYVFLVTNSCEFSLIVGLHFGSVFGKLNMFVLANLPGNCHPFFGNTDQFARRKSFLWISSSGTGQDQNGIWLSLRPGMGLCPGAFYIVPLKFWCFSTNFRIFELQNWPKNNQKNSPVPIPKLHVPYLFCVPTIKLSRPGTCRNSRSGI